MKCPRCTSEINDDAKLCRYCGATLEGLVKPSASAISPLEGDGAAEDESELDDAEEVGEEKVELDEEWDKLDENGGAEEEERNSETESGASAVVPPNPTPNAPIVFTQDYFILNIIATVVCCCPVGYIGLIGAYYGYKANEARESGDSFEAALNAKVAKVLLWIVLTGPLACIAFACAVGFVEWAFPDPKTGSEPVAEKTLEQEEEIDGSEILLDALKPDGESSSESSVE